MRKQAFINDGIPISDTDYDVNGAWDQTRYTNWQKELGGSATINDFRTSISGGSETTQFLISGNEPRNSPSGDFRYIKEDS
jgi:hypothetical protein